MEEKKNRLKYKKLLDFMCLLKTDKEMSKYLFMETRNIKNLYEYRYNNELLLCMNSFIDKTTCFKRLREVYADANYNEGSWCKVIDSLNIDRKKYYDNLKIEYEQIKTQTYEVEDVLYNKYILNRREDSHALI